MTALEDLPPVRTATLDSADDLEALVAAERPVVVRGLVSHWPALIAGRGSPAGLNAYFKTLDRGAPVPVMEAPARAAGKFGYAPDLREFSFTKRHRPLSETLDRIEALIGKPDAGVVAIQLLLLSQLPGFMTDNPMELLPNVTPRLWLGGPVKTQIHNDRDHNLACVLAGRRRFVLFPPEQVANLYIGPLDNPPPLSLVDPEVPDLDLFPRFGMALAEASVAKLDPGDALFMPKHWWHHVTSRDPYNAMVNYWWGDDATAPEQPYDLFLAALLALKDLPAGERSYWRAMFDAYVFRADGDVTAHIPPSLRGVLGGLTPRERTALRQRLKSTMFKIS